jgi:hypothetical protein
LGEITLEVPQVKIDISSFGPAALQVHEYLFAIKVTDAIGWYYTSNPL